MDGFLFGRVSFVRPGGQVDFGMPLGRFAWVALLWTARANPEGGGDVAGKIRRPVEKLYEQGALQTSSMVVLITVIYLRHYQSIKIQQEQLLYHWIVRGL